MKKTIKCSDCKGTGKILEVIPGIFKDTMRYRMCTSCDGLGSYIIDEYICKHCGRIHRLLGFECFTGQCEKCYADVETGKYIDNFFYITKNDLPEISKIISLLLKEGYMPVGRPFYMNQYWISQAVIKKDKNESCNCRKK